MLRAATAAATAVATASTRRAPLRRRSAATAASRCATALSALGFSGDQHAGGFDGSNWIGSGAAKEIVTPIDGSVIATVTGVNSSEYEQVAAATAAATASWSSLPAPARGDVVRVIGDRLRKHKKDLGEIVTLEMGKIRAEGEGEVQEMIDICDFAVGLSRQLYGLTMASERPSHRMMEQWHPRGVVGVISAFNFPVAVWSWNAALAAVCGNATIWKPSPQSAISAIACTKIAADVCKEMDVDPAIFSLIYGGDDIGAQMVNDNRVKLISATGSTAMGKKVAAAAATRMAPTILELGGNNALIVTPSARLDLAINAIVFGAVGTAGQRCTSTRRLIVHASIKDQLVAKITEAYKKVPIGDPLESSTLMGPLVNADAVANMEKVKTDVVKQGGRILTEDHDLSHLPPSGFYVSPVVAEAENQYEAVQHETFAPILYVISYGSKTATPTQAVDEIQEAIALNNGVPQGLSSAIFTDNMREAELFYASTGSDCGIANVNIGTSGAEIGGAFGGEKETGGGREAGSDSWKMYMRRQTSTTNYSTELPLAQGLKFTV